MAQKYASVSVWEDIPITLKFSVPLYGSLPVEESKVAAFVEQKIHKGKLEPTRLELTDEGVVKIFREGVSLEELHEEKVRQVLGEKPFIPDKEIEKRSLTFMRRGGKIVVFGGTLRSHLKDGSRVLSSLVLPRKVEGQRSLAVRATAGLYVREEWIPVLRDGKPQKEGDMWTEFFLHLTNPATGAPMSSLKRVEGFHAGVTISFTLAVLAGVVTMQELEMILVYGGLHGYGQERSRGMGRYEFTIGEGKGKQKGKHEAATV